jgi:integrase
LGFHVTKIAELLYGYTSPEHLRDNLVFELAALGISPGEIANLPVTALLPVSATTTTTAATTAATAAPADAGADADADADADGDDDDGDDDGDDVDWEPSMGEQRPSDTATVRQVIADALDWPGQIRARRDQVMVLVGYTLALRRSELCALRLGDVAFEVRGALVTIVKSKTDQEGKEKKLPISAQRKPNPATDTVGLLRAWCGLLRSAGARADTPLFPAFDRWGHVLTRRAGRVQRPYPAVSPQSWSERLATLARSAAVFEDLSGGDGSYPLSPSELEERYLRVSGHSLRRGFVTSALLADQDPIIIAKHTRHSDIDMIMRYADELRLLDGVKWSERIFGDPLGEVLSANG